MSLHKSAQSPPDSSTLPSDTLDEILLKHRSDTIAIYQGKSNGLDIGTSASEAKAKLENLLAEAYKKGYNTGYIKAKRNDEQRKLTTVADRLFNMAQELYTAAHENETKLPPPNARKSE